MSDRPFVRPEVAAAKPYVPGLSIEEIQAKYGLSRVVKLASNENPLGVSPVVRDVLARKAGLAFRYPQLGYPKLRAAAARALGVAQEQVVAGNGSDEIIDLLIRTLCRPGQDVVMTARPCFSVYCSQARLCGVELRQLDLNPDFSLPLEAMLAQARELGDRLALVFVTTPDNPSGAAMPAERLLEFARALPSRTVLAIDEAYVHFVDDPACASLLSRLTELGDLTQRLVFIRTFSKAYGLAGLRLGLGILAPWLAEAMLRVQIPFSVNLLAEEAGIAALGDEVHLAETLRVTLEGRQLLQRELAALGCRVWPSQANFVMFQPPMPAKEVHEGLLRRGVIARPLASYGLTDNMRVSVGRDDENREFLSALAAVLREGAK